MYHLPMMMTGVHHSARYPYRFTPGSASCNAGMLVVTHTGAWLER